LALIAVGFRLHTGWAAMVAVSADCKVYLRRRVELIDDSVPRFMYHAAAEMPVADAERLIDSARELAFACAQRAVADAIQHLRAANLRVVACGVSVGSSKLPADLSAILRSHALIHAAEGVLFQTSVIAAAEQQGLSVTPVREKGLWAGADPKLRERIEKMRSEFGPPWTLEQKIATAVALAALEDK